MVSVTECQGKVPGSIPASGIFFFFKLLFLFDCYKLLLWYCKEHDWVIRMQSLIVCADELTAVLRGFQVGPSLDSYNNYKVFPFS